VPGLLERGLASHLVGLAVLGQAAELLAPHGILLMPLKGIWLQRLIYPDPAERPITDVDVLVPERRYREVLARLAEAGWTLCGANVSEASYRAPGLPLPLDVHKRLFGRGAFRLPNAELFARARPDAEAFGLRLLLPDPLDVFAHLIGHFVKSRGFTPTPELTVRDLVLLAAAGLFEPRRCAAHLDASGLARAARYTLPLIAASDAGGFGRAVLDALPPDPVGAGIARAMTALGAHMHARSGWSAALGFVLEPSLPRALLSFGLRVWDRRSDYSAHHDA
jgi:hypothetical protein